MSDFLVTVAVMIVGYCECDDALEIFGTQIANNVE